MNVGDIFWIDYPLRGGHAQSSRRPTIVLQTPAIGSQIPTVLTVPLTSPQNAIRFPATILVKTTQENGLRVDSVALVFQLAAVDKTFLTSKLGKVSDELLEQIFQALDEITGRI